MIRLAYIAAPSYSGSTLLTMLLNAHPDLATIGELKWGAIDIGSYRCSCGALLRECRFWDAVEKDVQQAGLPFDRVRPSTDFRCRTQPWVDRVARSRVRGSLFERLRKALLTALPGSRRTWPTIRTVNRAIIESVLRLQKGRVFVDASKDPVRLKYLIETGDYEVNLLQLMRDGRGVVHSALKHGQGNTVQAAREWRNTHRQIGFLLKRYAQVRRLLIQYEELCANPAEVLQRIHRFLGVPAQGELPDCSAVTHHVLGNEMRLRAIEQIRADEKWRSALPISAMKAFERVAGLHNRMHGYA
jgi:hypothetical protein